MKNDANTITCSFVVDKATYDEYKSIVSRTGGNVKGNLVRYMRDVIEFG